MRTNRHERRAGQAIKRKPSKETSEPLYGKGGVVRTIIAKAGRIRVIK